MTKRVATFLFALLMMMQFASTAAFAAVGEPTIAVVGGTAAAGETVAVDIVLSNNPGIVTMQLELEYDEDVLTLVQVQDKGLLGASTHKPELVSPYILRWANNTATENFTSNGTVVTLVFEIAANADRGVYPVTVSYQYDNYDIMDWQMNKVQFAVDNGAVTVGNAAPTPLESFEYERNGNELTITGYVSDAEKVVIADSYEIDGTACTVTAIGVEAFIENEDITSIIMNAGLKVVDEAAFYGCVNLSSVKLNSNLEMIGIEAFYGCEALTSVAVLGKDTQLDEMSLGYMRSGRKDVLVEGFQLIGYAGSTAQIYAQENEITFKEITVTFAGASLSLQHNLAINYKVEKALFEDYGYTAPYVVFELNGVQTTMTDYIVDGDRYVFTFRNIAPNQMNDTIYATLYATYGGVEYASATREYSVAEYCYSMLTQCTEEKYSELRTLLVDLLHYGAASQTYTGYRTDALVNASLTAAQLQWGTSAEPALNTVLDTTYKTVENPTAKWKGAGLYLQESVSMRLRFTAECIDSLSVKIESGANTWTISSDKFLEEDGVYYVYFTGLDAGQMRQSVYLTICSGNTPVSNTVRYSIGSYAYEKHNSTIAGLPELVKAMMKYGDSAYEYVN